MMFEKYYRELTRRNAASTPSADEARRDYLDALHRTLDGLLSVR